MQDHVESTILAMGLRPVDFKERFTHAQGPGGQNVNKVASCVVIVHLPTGLRVKCQEHRTQLANRRAAWLQILCLIEKRKKQKERIERQARELKRRQSRGRSRKGKEEMLKAKKKQAAKKINRQKVEEDE